MTPGVSASETRTRTGFTSLLGAAASNIKYQPGHGELLRLIVYRQSSQKQCQNHQTFPSVQLRWKQFKSTAETHLQKQTGGGRQTAGRRSGTLKQPFPLSTDPTLILLEMFNNSSIFQQIQKPETLTGVTASQVTSERVDSYSFINLVTF